VSDARPIIGHIRFSYYGTTDTRLAPDPAGIALAQLYDETRMARRFHLFERLTLPSLVAQTDRNFSLVVMSSDVMPDRFKDRLVQVMRPFPNAIVDFSTERQGREAFRPYMQAALEANPDGAVHFRLDDDDALSCNYIRRLRLFSEGRRPGTLISFPTGILLFPAASGKAQGLSMITRVLLTGAGLALVSGKNHLKSPFEMRHLQAWKTAPLASDPEFAAYIRCFHFNNDTALRHDRVLRGIRNDRQGPKAEAHAAEVDRAAARNFPFIDRPRLDGLIGELQAITSLADLPAL
jgi:Putative rhamnosyl transferase